MKQIPDPKTMLALKNLSLAAKTTLDHFMLGLNQSRTKGEGAEFSQYRQYFPGDDLRNLDWKVLARTGRYYIKQSEPEQTIAVHLLLDASASMKHDCGNYAKIDYGKYLAACLALLAYRQGDQIGLSFFNERETKQIVPQQHAQQLPIIYQALAQLEPNGRLENLEGFKYLLNAKNRELLVFISDLYEHDGEILRLIKLFVALGHEVIVLHLMASNELEVSYQGYDALEDAETGNLLMLGDMKEQAYQQQMKEYLNQYKKQLLENNVYYCLVNANDPAEKTLREFLIVRNSLILR
jgi:uncharacterized protein (DUF58 family)